MLKRDSGRGDLCCTHKAQHPESYLNILLAKTKTIAVAYQNILLFIIPQNRCFVNRNFLCDYAEFTNVYKQIFDICAIILKQNIEYNRSDKALNGCLSGG
jgi:hypothetical protein